METEYDPSVTHWTWFARHVRGPAGILRVVKETPKQVEMSNHRRFWKKDMREVGSSSSWGYSRCEPATERHKQIILRRYRIRRCENFAWDTLEDEQLIAIMHILDGAEAMMSIDYGDQDES